MREQAVVEARNLMRNTSVAVLSTVSNNLKGYPFGSVSPYYMDSQGDLFFYISDIAQHAKNLALDSRLSVTVYQPLNEGDQNQQARITLVGDALPVDDSLQAEYQSRYIQCFPEAATYQSVHGFKIWRMSIKRVRFIGGFGKIFWIEQNEWAQQKEQWDWAKEKAMLEHMNQDHQDAMQAMLARHHQVMVKSLAMVAIFTDGCFIRANQTNYYFPFPTSSFDSDDVRKSLVELAQQARQAA